MHRFFIFMQTPAASPSIVELIIFSILRFTLSWLKLAASWLYIVFSFAFYNLSKCNDCYLKPASLLCILKIFSFELDVQSIWNFASLWMGLFLISYLHPNSMLSLRFFTIENPSGIWVVSSMDRVEMPKIMFYWDINMALTNSEGKFISTE